MPSRETRAPAALHPPAPLPPDLLRLTARDRVAIFAHGQWSLSGSKTGVQVLRFSTAEVVGVIDPDRVGTDGAAIPGVARRGPIPVVAGWKELLAAAPRPPNVAIVGIAPVGGRLPDRMRADVRAALESGVTVAAGLHTFLGDDPEFVAAARRGGARIYDLRRPPPDPVIATGAGRLVPVPVVTTIGTDCSIGKMTVAVAFRDAAKAAGIPTGFVATGQTGLLLEPDSGAAIDRCISDFAAGETERQVIAAARLDEHGKATRETPAWILVEGQAALSHPAYSGVTASLVHGSWPDAFILCHHPTRPHKKIDTVGGVWPLLHPRDEAALAELFVKHTTGAKVAAIVLASLEQDAAAYRASCERLRAETGLPVGDVLRDGAGPLMRAVFQHVIQHAKGKDTSRLVAGLERLR